MLWTVIAAASTAWGAYAGIDWLSWARGLMLGLLIGCMIGMSKLVKMHEKSNHDSRRKSPLPENREDEVWSLLKE